MADCPSFIALKTPFLIPQYFCSRPMWKRKEAKQQQPLTAVLFLNFLASLQHEHCIVTIKMFDASIADHRAWQSYISQVCAINSTKNLLSTAIWACTNGLVSGKLKHNFTFYCSDCGSQKIRSVFRVLGMYNFAHRATLWSKQSACFC